MRAELTTIGQSRVRVQAGLASQPAVRSGPGEAAHVQDHLGAEDRPLHQDPLSPEVRPSTKPHTHTHHRTRESIAAGRIEWDWGGGYGVEAQNPALGAVGEDGDDARVEGSNRGRVRRVDRPVAVHRRRSVGSFGHHQSVELCVGSRPTPHTTSQVKGRSDARSQARH